MSPRKFLLPIFLTLCSCLIVEDFALAQRGGRSSGGSSGRSSAGSSRSSGGSSAGRSSAGRSSGYSGSRSTPSSSSRSSSRSTYTPTRTSPTRTSPSRTTTRTTPTRTSTPRTVPSRTTTTTPTRDMGSSYGSTRGSAGSSSTRSGSTTPTVDLSGRSSTGYTGTGASSTRTPSTYDLSRRSSGFDSSSNSSRTGTLDDATIRLSNGASRTPSRTSTVPRAYGSRSGDSSLPAAARRNALAERLRQATISTTTPTPGVSSRSATSKLVDRYTPSTNRSSRSVRVGNSARDNASSSNARKPARPGETRRAAIDRTRGSRGARTDSPSASRTRGEAAPTASEARTQYRAQQIRSDRKAVRTMNARYDAAKRSDEGLRQRVANAARSASIATDIAVRSALSATPIAGLRDYGNANTNRSGNEQGYYDNGRWDGYGYGYNGYCNWYWNSCFPTWWNSCGWYIGIGWGWGWGWGYGSYWGSACYYPSSYRYCYPTYAYCSPSIIYNYYYDSEPVYPEVVEQPIAQAVSAPIPVPRTSDVGLRAATEYMALGDRAFTEGRYGDAVHYYAKAIEFAPEDGVLYLVLFDALFATGDYHYAAFALRRALELHPEIATLGLDKRSFYGSAADFEEQLALLERYISDHVIDNDARLVLGANYLFSLQPEKAVQFFDSPFSAELKETETGQVLFAAGLEMMAGK